MSHLKIHCTLTILWFMWQEFLNFITEYAEYTGYTQCGSVPSSGKWSFSCFSAAVLLWGIFKACLGMNEWTLHQGRNKGHMLCSKSHCRSLVMEWTTSCIWPMFTATSIYFTDAPYIFKCIIVVYCVLELCKHINTPKLALQLLHFQT